MRKSTITRIKSSIKKLAKKVNDSLYRLQKAGLLSDSKEYQTIMHYAVTKGNAKGYYNVNLDKGTIRVTSDTSRFTTDKELKDYETVLKNIVNAETRTVSGTRKALKKGYEKILEKMKIRKGSMPLKDFDYEKYRKLWRIYRNNVQSDKQSKMTSDDVFNLITSERGFYDLSENQIAEAFKYYNLYDSETATDMIYKEYEELF